MSLKLEALPDMNQLLRWLGNPPRSPQQVHGLNESDCEIVKVSDSFYLATTTDTLSEELLVGLYKNPYTAGWVTAQASLSDLAAVGARALGLLFSTQWGLKTHEEFKTQVARGFLDAVHSAKTFLLGGDNGSHLATVLTGVGIGVTERKPISRIGIKPGDVLCLTGKTGRGPALSFRFLRGESPEDFPEEHYRPTARLANGQVLSELAHAMMDTSDGVLSTLNTLRLMNGIGLELVWNPETLDPLAKAYCQERGIPLWLLWVGEHGDFELLVSVSPDKLDEARRLCPDLLPIGQAVADPEKTVVHFSQDSRSPRIIDFSIAQTLSSGQPVDPKALSQQLEQIIQSLRGLDFP